MVVKLARKTTPTGPPEASLLDRDGFIESEELADYLRVPLATLDQWASRGGGPMYHKIGKFRRYLPADVRSWIAGQRLAAAGNPQPPEPATQPRSARRSRREGSSRRDAADSSPAALPPLRPATSTSRPTRRPR
jgi:hypothetical protein